MEAGFLFPTFTCPNLKARLAVLDLLQEYGLDFQISEEKAPAKVDRDNFSDKEFKKISSSDKRLGEKLFFATRAIGLAVDNASLQANYTAHFLRMRGFKTSVHEMADDGRLKGVFFFVVSEAFENWVMVFRKKSAAL